MLQTSRMLHCVTGWHVPTSLITVMPSSSGSRRPCSPTITHQLLAQWSSNTSGATHPMTQHLIPEDLNPQCCSAVPCQAKVSNVCDANSSLSHTFLYLCPPSTLLFFQCLLPMSAITRSFLNFIWSGSILQFGRFGYQGPCWCCVELFHFSVSNSSKYFV